MRGARRHGYSGPSWEHFEVLLETGQPRQPRDYFQRSNDPEVWALLDDPEFGDVLGVRWQVRRASGAKGPRWRPPDFERLVEGALRKGTTENGVLGTKIMWAYFRDFVRLARRATGPEDVRPCEVPASVLPNLRRFVWMRRRDTTRQAVSCGRRSRPSSGARTPTRTSAGKACVSALPP